jgi:hypothetical protein
MGIIGSNASVSVTEFWVYPPITCFYRNLGGTLLEGSDTSSGMLQTFILILTAYPEAQMRAQAEIDQIIGSQTPPTWSDLEDLPYVKAFMEEVSFKIVSFSWLIIPECCRFRPVDPLLIPHAMSKDEYVCSFLCVNITDPNHFIQVDGMLLPANSVVFINLCKHAACMKLSQAHW